MRPRQPTIRLRSDAHLSAPVVELASQLNIPPTLAFAYWVRVLCWMSEHNPEGNVGAMVPEEIGAAAGVPKTQQFDFGHGFLAACADASCDIIGWASIGQPAKRAAAKRLDQAERDGAEREDRGNWITPYFDAWKEAYGGELAVAKNAQALKKLEAQYGAEEVLQRWVVMLKRNQPQFANAHLLVQGWATYAGGERDGMSRRKRAAAAFFDIVSKHGLVSMAGAGDAIRKLEQAGTIRSADRFIELLRRCDRNLLRDARVPAYAISHIEERLGDALDG